jgi:surface glycoprotein (TIGR04207 family)
MTDTQKLRAAFLAALMVASVFGGTVAFAGAGAASTAGLSLEQTAGGVAELGQGESGTVQQLRFEDTNDNSNAFYIDNITLTPETGSSYVEAADVSQVQFLVGGQGVGTVDGLTAADFENGITLDDFTSSSGSLSNGDVGADGDAELYADDGFSTETVTVKVFFDSGADATDGAEFAVKSTEVTLLDDSQLSDSVNGNAELFPGPSRTANAGSERVLTLDAAVSDATPPEIGSFDPADGATLTSATATLSADVTDALAGVDTSTVSVTLASGDETLLDAAGLGTEGVSYDGTTVAVRPGTGAVPELADGDYTLTVSASDLADDTNSAEGSVSFAVNVPAELTVTKGKTTEGTPQLTVEASERVDGLQATVTSEDFYGESVFRTVDEFERSGTTYTTALDLPDGEYRVKAFAEGTEAMDSFAVDREDPHVVDADVVGVGQDALNVRVEFNEPVAATERGSLSASLSVDADGYRSAGDDVTFVGDSGYAIVSVPADLQTADSPPLEVSLGAYEERFAVGSPTANPTESVGIDTIELDLKEGQNLVSVPAETGSLDLTAQDLPNVEAVWRYDDGEWDSYVPGPAADAFTTMEGGQGYVVVASAPTEIDVNVANVPRVDGASAPNQETLERGWNLIGHFQEGAQEKKVALATVNENVFDTLGEDASSDSLTSVRAFEPGEAYWTFLDFGDDREEDVYTRNGLKTAPDVTDVTVDAGADGALSAGESVDISATVTDADSAIGPVEALTAVGETTLTPASGDTYTGTLTVSDPIGIPSGEYLAVIAATNDRSHTAQETVPLAVDATAGAPSVSLDVRAGDENAVELVVSSNERLSELSVSGGDDLSGGPWTLAEFSAEQVGSTYYYNHTTSTAIVDGGTYSATVDAAADRAGVRISGTPSDSLSASTGGSGTAFAIENFQWLGDAEPFQASSSHDQEISFDVTGLAADGNTDYFRVEFPSAFQFSGVSSVTVENASSQNAQSSTQDRDDDGQPEIVFTADANDPTVTVNAQYSVTYPDVSQPTDYAVTAHVESGGSLNSGLVVTDTLTVAPETGGPALASTSPLAASDASPDTVTVAFNETLDAASVTTGDFAVAVNPDGSTTTPSVSRVAVNGDTATLTMVDGTAFASGDTVQVTVAEGTVADGAGNANDQRLRAQVGA